MKAKNNFSGRMIISTLISLGIFIFTWVMGGPAVLALSTYEATGGSNNSGVNAGIYTSTLFLPIILTPRAEILCDGQVYDGYNKALFTLETERDKNPAIQKVIRNCTFKNSTKPPITINDAQNVLIIGNTFENIRTNVPGVGVHAINVRCGGACNINNIVIKNNNFENIGADGIQLGSKNRTIKNVIIENNTFQGNETTGENGVDIKGVDGPIYVLRNNMFGFRPCESPTWDPPGTQDCSGASGSAMVIHRGESSGSANNVIVEGNRFYDSIYGLFINLNASNITVRNNEIFNNLEVGMWIIGVSNVTVEGNNFTNNPRDLRVQNCTNCTIR
jgi:parallel beta-helix repeat protein